MNECDEEKKRERERKSIQCKGLVLLCVYSLSLSIESDIRIESVDASLDVKKRRKKKEERNPLGMRRQPSRKKRNREEIIYVTISLFFLLSLFYSV